MAIFRRWVRNLPLSAADRRHVHHLLIGLGLNQRQAALLLYCFSGFLCGAVMLGVALRNEYLTLVLGISGCLVFLLVVTSRRDELANLRDDLQDRLTRRRQERQAAKLAWEAIQRIELATDGDGRLRDRRPDGPVAGVRAGADLVRRRSIHRWPGDREDSIAVAKLGQLVSGPSAIFRLSGGQGLWITVSLGLPADSPLAADIVFRYLQRLCQALAERLEWLGFAAIDAAETGRPEPSIASCPTRGSTRIPSASGSVSRMITIRRRRQWTESKPTRRPAPPSQPARQPAPLPSIRRPSNRPQTTWRRSDAVSGWCWPSPFRWPSRRRSWCSSCPPVYLVKAEIEINPPEVDPWLSTLVAHEGRPPRPIEPGQLRRQPRGSAPQAGTRRAGRRRPEHRTEGEPVRRPGLRALQDAHRPAGQEEPTRSSSPSKATTRH